MKSVPAIADAMHLPYLPVFVLDESILVDRKQYPSALFTFEYTHSTSAFRSIHICNALAKSRACWSVIHI
jgi:hypothetical protein